MTHRQLHVGMQPGVHAAHTTRARGITHAPCANCHPTCPSTAPTVSPAPPLPCTSPTDTQHTLPNTPQPDEAAALLHYYWGAGGGDAVSAMALGYRHTYGLGVPKSCWSATAYYEPVAQQVRRRRGGGGAGAGCV